MFYTDNFGTEVTTQRRDIPQNSRYTFVAKILKSKVPVKTFIFSKVGTCANTTKPRIQRIFSLRDNRRTRVLSILLAELITSFLSCILLQFCITNYG